MSNKKDIEQAYIELAEKIVANATKNGRAIISKDGMVGIICVEDVIDLAFELKAILASNRKPTVPEVGRLVQHYMDKNYMGGALHVVLEDGNLEDSFLQEVAQDQEDQESALLAQVLLRMSMSQRERLYRSL